MAKTILKKLHPSTWLQDVLETEQQKPALYKCKTDLGMNGMEQKPRNSHTATVIWFSTNVQKTYINNCCYENWILTLQLDPHLSVVQRAIQNGPGALISDLGHWCYKRTMGNASRYRHRKWLLNYFRNDSNRSGNKNGWQIELSQIKRQLQSKGGGPDWKGRLRMGQSGPAIHLIVDED